MIVIEEYGFGKIVVNGVTYVNDIRIVRNKVLADWWRERGHRVEIQDVQEMISPKPEIMVIGKGNPGMMKSSASLKAFLQQEGISLIEVRTSEAVKVFNQLTAEGKAVSAGFHLTC